MMNAVMITAMKLANSDIVNLDDVLSIIKEGLHVK